MITLLICLITGGFLGMVVVVIRDRRSGTETSTWPVLIGAFFGFLVGIYLATDFLPNRVINRLSHENFVLLARAEGEGDYLDYSADSSSELMYVYHTRVEDSIYSTAIYANQAKVDEDLEAGAQAHMNYTREDCESGWWDWFILCPISEFYEIHLPVGSWTKPV